MNLKSSCRGYWWGQGVCFLDEVCYDAAGGEKKIQHGVARW